MFSCGYNEYLNHDFIFIIILYANSSTYASYSLQRNLFSVDNDYFFYFVQNIHSKHTLLCSNNTNNLSKSNNLIEIYYIVLVKHTKLYGGEILRIYHTQKTHISLTNGGLCPY